MLIMIVYLIFNICLYVKLREKFISNIKTFKKYRLGDIITGFICKKDNNLYNNYPSIYPNSLAAKYINRVKNIKNEDEKFYNYDILYDIIDIKNKPKNGINIHLRIGDVVRGFKNGKYIFHVSSSCKNYYYGIQPKVYDKFLKFLKKETSNREIKLFYGCHVNCNKYSEKYIGDIKKIISNNGFKVKESRTFNPDTDFIEMCKSDIFIKSVGGYSNHISKIVEKNNGRVFNIKDFENK